jgi:glucose/arabinose dehydrogenase
MIGRRLACSALLVLAACSSTVPKNAAKLSVVADGFNGPTQISDGPGGLLLVAQLNGEENAATGQVIAFDPSTKAKRVVLDHLDKPTGVLWNNGMLWVMVRRGLVKAAWAEGTAASGPVETVLDNLPFNGRSEGTLTPVDGGAFLYETTGTLVGDIPQEGSGTLWRFDPRDGSSRVIATGVKNAYAHQLLGDGRVVTTEIGDNIANAPLEEVNIVPLDRTSDLGWPRCAGNQQCAGVVDPIALFPKSSTPTGIALVNNDLYVTLFVTGQLMRVPIPAAGTAPLAQPVEVLSGLKGPHTVLARPDGSLWISEHLANRIVSFRP